MQSSRARMQMIASLVIFGTIGIFVRSIPLPSAVIANVRGFVGVGFLAAVMALKKQPLHIRAIRRNLPALCLSGVFLGLNWIFLFEAYRYTTVATATLCYYMDPVLVVLASPLVHERLTGRKLLCAGVALAGMIPVSGVLQSGFSGAGELRGVALGLGAAVLYAAIVLMNKTLSPGLSAYDKTVVQLGVSALVLLPYNLLTSRGALTGAGAAAWGLLILVGVVHTGLAYALYFGAVEFLPVQSSALLSYIDPVVAIFLSAVLLHEELTPATLLGAVMILGSTLVSEMPERASAQPPSADAQN